MKIKKNYELWNFLLSAFVGGSFGCYAVIRYGMFASAQTMNLVRLFLSVYGASFKEFIFRLIVACFYGFGVALVVLIPRYTKANIKIVSLISSAISTIILAFEPVSISMEAVCIPVFFSMAVQWGAFPGACGYAASSIFLTNTFRQTIVGMTEFLCTKERKHLERFYFHGMTLVSFALGCGAAYYFTSFFGYRSIIYVLVPLLLMFVFIKIEEGIKDK